MALVVTGAWKEKRGEGQWQSYPWAFCNQEQSACWLLPLATHCIVTVGISGEDREVGCSSKKVQLVSHVKAAEFNLIIYLQCYLAEVIYLSLVIPLSPACLDLQMEGSE